MNKSLEFEIEKEVKEKSDIIEQFERGLVGQEAVNAKFKEYKPVCVKCPNAEYVIGDNQFCRYDQCKVSAMKEYVSDFGEGSVCDLSAYQRLVKRKIIK